MGHDSGYMAEAKVMLKGMINCLEAGFTNVIVETDSLLIVDILNGKLEPPWQIKQITEQMVILSRAGNFVFKHIFREGNTIADLLANMGEESKTFSIFNETTFLP